MANTSQTSALTEREIFYFRQRYRNRVFQSVIAFFATQAEETGLTKRELARRLAKDPAQITRWFSGPGNWTLDTVSDLLLAMGAEMGHAIVPLDDDSKDHRSTRTTSSAVFRQVVAAPTTGSTGLKYG